MVFGKISVQPAPIGPPVPDPGGTLAPGAGLALGLGVFRLGLGAAAVLGLSVPAVLSGLPGVLRGRWSAGVRAAAVVVQGEGEADHDQEYAGHGDGEYLAVRPVQGIVMPYLRAVRRAGPG
jgi:hypothetical protein